MPRSLVTEVSQRHPTLCMLFNEHSGPGQVADIISRAHAFVDFEAYDSVDENGRNAFLLLVYCETATADQLFDMIGSRLPDYVLARKFPVSRVEAIRKAARDSGGPGSHGGPSGQAAAAPAGAPPAQQGFTGTSSPLTSP